jgi:hypothetical protein
MFCPLQVTHLACLCLCLESEDEQPKTLHEEDRLRGQDRNNLRAPEKRGAEDEKRSKRRRRRDREVARSRGEHIGEQPKISCARYPRIT